MPAQVEELDSGLVSYAGGDRLEGMFLSIENKICCSCGNRGSPPEISTGSCELS